MHYNTILTLSPTEEHKAGKTKQEKQRGKAKKIERSFATIGKCYTLSFYLE